MERNYLVKVEGLYKSYVKYEKFKKRKVEVLKDINFEIKKGEIFGLVGESGCGKSTICNLLLGLDKIDEGKIIFEDIEITSLGEKEMIKLRKYIQAVFQDSKSSLNPRMKAFDIINEPLKNYKMEDKKRVRELIKLVGLEESSLTKYPHEFSGGQRQRISIARSLALNPKFIILDESSSNLDTITLNKILNLIKKLNKELDVSYLLVSHDINIVKKLCHRIAIIENGTIVEVLENHNLSQATHSYTKKLLSSQ